MKETLAQYQPSTLTDRLHECLSEVPFSKIADLTGVSSESVRRYFAGQRPPASFVERVCTEFGFSANWLLLGIGPQSMEGLPDGYARSATSAVLVDELAKRAKVLLACAESVVESKPSPNEKTRVAEI